MKPRFRNYGLVLGLFGLSAVLGLAQAHAARESFECKGLNGLKYEVVMNGQTGSVSEILEDGARNTWGHLRVVDRQIPGETPPYRSIRFVDSGTDELIGVLNIEGGVVSSRVIFQSDLLLQIHADCVSTASR